MLPSTRVVMGNVHQLIDSLEVVDVKSAHEARKLVDTERALHDKSDAEKAILNAVYKYLAEVCEANPILFQ